MTAPLNPALFHFDPQVLWVMHCAEGPVPRAAMRSVRTLMQKELRPWDLSWSEDFLGLPAATRAGVAQLLDVSPEDLSLTSNTSSGLLCVAQGFPWKYGEETLAALGEFPSNAWPWLAQAGRGAMFREAPLWEGHQSGHGAWEGRPPRVEDDPESRLLEALGPKTKLLALSWVRFQDGLKLDLARLGEGCRAKGVHLVVDGIQGLGTHRPDLRFVDAFASGGHKGLLAPQGMGLLWTEAAFRQKLQPLGTWLSVEDGTDFSRPSTDFARSWLADGRRLEPGGPNLLAMAAFMESLQILNAAGQPAIEAHVLKLQKRLLQRLEGSAWGAEVERLGALLEAGRLGPILAFHHGGRGQDALQGLLRQGFRKGIFASVREGYLRIAFHGFHTEEEVDRVAAWMRS